MRKTRVLILIAFVTAAAAVGSFVPPSVPARAEGVVLGDHGALAGGDGTLHAAYAGTTTGTPDRLGDTIEFRVQPAAGSSANPVFANGQTTTSATLAGGACQATREDVALVTDFTRCFAIAALTSVQPGSVELLAQNLEPGHSLFLLQLVFVPARAVTPRASASQIIDAPMRHFTE